VSATKAPRSPSGWAAPVVESSAVWCSISELSEPPRMMMVTDSQIQVSMPTTAPSEP
jgi:hypothetical protein